MEQAELVELQLGPHFVELAKHFLLLKFELLVEQQLLHLLEQLVTHSE